MPVHFSSHCAINSSGQGPFQSPHYEPPESLTGMHQHVASEIPGQSAQRSGAVENKNGYSSPSANHRREATGNAQAVNGGGSHAHDERSHDIGSHRKLPQLPRKIREGSAEKQDGGESADKDHVLAVLIGMRDSADSWRDPKDRKDHKDHHNVKGGMPQREAHEKPKGESGGSGRQREEGRRPGTGEKQEWQANEKMRARASEGNGRSEMGDTYERVPNGAGPHKHANGTVPSPVVNGHGRRVHENGHMKSRKSKGNREEKAHKRERKERSAIAELTLTNGQRQASEKDGDAMDVGGGMRPRQKLADGDEDASSDSSASRDGGSFDGERGGVGSGYDERTRNESSEGNGHLAHPRDGGPGGCDAKRARQR